jgi:Holliday junction DNA helicase RuvB
MEDFYVDLGKGGMKFDLPKFTLVGATTESGNILRPMYDRFTYKFELYLYNNSDLSIIVKNSAEKLGLSLTKDAVIGIIKRARGTPRIANAHLIWLRDYSSGHVTRDDVDKAMTMMGIDKNGLTKNDHRYLSLLRKYKTAVGLNTIVAAIGLSRNVVENDIEPFLLRQNLIMKTSRGRVLA